MQPPPVPIPRITWQSPVEFAAIYPSEISARQPAVNFVTAMHVINHFLGGEWLERHTNPFIKKPGFYRLEIAEGGEELVALQAQKLVDLGELLLNLQDVGGFESCIRRLRDGALEPTLAELSLAAMFYVNDVSFRFVAPIGKKKKRLRL